MLRSSLCLLGGLSLDAERRLWRQGILTWEDYRRSADGVFSPARHHRVLADIPAAETALEKGDLRFFLKHLPAAARMRVWPLLADRAVYLDIETTGLGPEDVPTTAVLYDGHDLRAFVAGRNLHDLPESIRRNAVLVTYNGRRFDLPHLRCHLGCKFPYPHLDLAPVLRATGYGPGLKASERQLGVTRRLCADMDGTGAVALWRRFVEGEASALETLLTYNAEDTLSLERVLVAACNASMKGCPCFQPISLPKQPDAGVLKTPRSVINGVESLEDHKM